MHLFSFFSLVHISQGRTAREKTNGHERFGKHYKKRYIASWRGYIAEGVVWIGELAELPNIGAVTEKQLNLVGIYTFEQLKKAGSKNAWLRIKAIDDSACIHRLYSFEGAILGIKKSQLPEEIKKDLKLFYNAFK